MQPLNRVLLVLTLAMPLFAVSQNVGIGTANPLERLHVAGNVRVNGLVGVGNRVVGSDANGTLIIFGAGTNGQVLTQTGGGPAWTNASNDWTTLGNAGTNVATNFLGTTDNMAFAVRTNNAERMRVTNAGYVVVNSATPFTGDMFSSYATGVAYAVNGYSSGTGSAGYFSESGGASAVQIYSSSATGNALTITGASAGTNNNNLVDIYASNSSQPTVLIQTDGAYANADGMEIDVNGAVAKRGIDMYMDAATTGIGVAIFHNGNGRPMNLQSQSTTTTEPALFIQSVSNGSRVINAQNTSNTSTTMVGYFGQSSNGVAVATYGNAASVWGQSNGIRSGVFLASGLSSSTTCLQGAWSGPANAYDGIGVLGTFAPVANWGYGVVGTGNWYGVYSNGNMGATGAKPFQIDHPLDPENKYLRHYALESPEVLNMYRGNVILDAQGRGSVQLPDYFHEINIEFSYNLTPIGGPADLYIQTEIDPSGKFEIAGGNAGQKVSWYVYAKRNDLYIRTYPLASQVEIEKRPNDKGQYLRPELYGQPAEKGIFYKYQADPSKVDVMDGSSMDPVTPRNRPAPKVLDETQAPSQDRKGASAN